MKEVWDLTEKLDKFEMRFRTTSYMVRLGLLVLTLVMTIFYWSYTPCTNQGELCRHQNGMKVSEITTFCLRVFFVMAIVAQVLKLLNVSLFPTIAGLGVVLATCGYMFNHQLFDFVSGMTLLLSQDISIGDTVELHLSSRDETGRVVVQNFRTFHLECWSPSKRVRMFVPYSKIHRIAKPS